MPVARTSARLTVLLLLAGCHAPDDPPSPKLDAPPAATTDAPPEADASQPPKAATAAKAATPKPHPRLAKAERRRNWEVTVTPMPRSTLYRSWAEVHDELLSEDDVDIDSAGPFSLLVVWPENESSRVAAVFERADGLLQLWYLGDVKTNEECGVKPRGLSVEPVLDGRLAGVELLSVAFASIDERVDADHDNPCAIEEPVWIDLLVDPVSNVSVMLTRHTSEPDPGNFGADRIPHQTLLRVAEDGVRVSAYGIDDELLIPFE